VDYLKNGLNNCFFLFTNYQCLKNQQFKHNQIFLLIVFDALKSDTLSTRDAVAHAQNVKYDVNFNTLSRWGGRGGKNPTIYWLGTTAMYGVNTLDKVQPYSCLYWEDILLALILWASPNLSLWRSYFGTCPKLLRAIATCLFFIGWYSLSVWFFGRRPILAFGVLVLGHVQNSYER